MKPTDYVFHFDIIEPCKGKHQYRITVIHEWMTGWLRVIMCKHCGKEIWRAPLYKRGLR